MLLILILLTVAALNLALYTNDSDLDFDWINLLVGILIPLTGWTLLLRNKKAGWIICLFYFSVFLGMISFSIAEELLSTRNLSAPGTNTRVRQAVFVLLVSAVEVLLLTRAVRRQLQMSPRFFLGWLLVAFLLTGLLLYIM
ncbi:MAG: hypothetical protein EOO06_03975 [Chitinophagaceae bacterium]|nr:MAG: hypothetical protein EOO06_03975 [Chitinophagaceae bacterium]